MMSFCIWQKVSTKELSKPEYRKSPIVKDLFRKDNGWAFLHQNEILPRILKLLRDPQTSFLCNKIQKLLLFIEHGSRYFNLGNARPWATFENNKLLRINSALRKIIGIDSMKNPAAFILLLEKKKCFPLDRSCRYSPARRMRETEDSPAKELTHSWGWPAENHVNP